jgi:cytochrome c2
MEIIYEPPPGDGQQENRRMAYPNKGHKNMQKLLIAIFLSSTIATAAQAQDAAAGQTGFALCGVCHAVDIKQFGPDGKTK